MSRPLRSALLSCCLLVLLAPTTSAQTLDVPDQIIAGDQLVVRWSGPFEESDYITVVPPDAPANRWKDYRYLREGNPLTLPLPPDPGTWELRWNRESEGTVITRKTLELTAPAIEIQAPPAAGLGEAIQVRWTGPGFEGDFITVVTPETPANQWGNYTYTSTGNPLSLTLPDEPGAYEIRYSHGGTNRALAAVPIQVGGAKIVLDAAKEVEVGSAFTVRFEGPRNTGDFITVVPVGTAATAWENYADVSAEPTVELIAPGEPGDYEVRYSSGQSNRALESIPIRLVDASASLVAPGKVDAGSFFEVTWQGPGNHRDFIAIEREVDGKLETMHWDWISEMNPLRLRAPRIGGTYRLAYRLGQGSRLLASRTLEVAATEAPGRLRVVAGGEGTAASALGASTAVEVILDASGSMLQRENGKRRIELAREALGSLVDSLPSGTPFALRAFGHKEAGSCRSDLEIPLAPLSPAAVRGQLSDLQAMNLAKTPIGRSLELVREDTAGHEGEVLVVLITDGEETCDGDPAAAIAGLRSAGIETRVNIVGLAIDDMALKQTFSAWAEAGSGRFFDASDAASLGDELLSAVRLPFEVVDSDGQIVARGEVGGEAVEAPAGRFTLRIDGGEEQAVEVLADELVTVSLGG